MTSVFIREGEEKTWTQRKRRSSDKGAERVSDMATSRGSPGAERSWKRPRRILPQRGRHVQMPRGERRLGML